ncbi:hypothetical protein GCM10009789_03180 [Kribbella sancticallisti]|uniref:Baseplate assembly protein n=1 Tax=Kribbella sancticallisti TaxID=460087 RepID=A0ABN2C874_9ACTN
MHGDFSRGHEPDRVRGRDYRRVLLQQGRPVLDSDVAATVDSLLDEVRATTRALGCTAGSTDLGYLITPGRLVTIFSRVARGLQVMSGSPDAWVDFRRRYAGRYPALHLAAPAGPVRVQVPVIQPVVAGPAGIRLTLWAIVESATSLTVNGVSVDLAPTSGGGPVPSTFTVTGGTIGRIELELDEGEVWLYQLEQYQPVGPYGMFAISSGTYQVDGLVVHTRGGRFPAATFPESDGFAWQGSPTPTPPLPGLTWVPTAGERAVAYLEVWERLITAVEDPGIREVALGETDTSVRTELIGQVKLAEVGAAIPVPGQIGQVMRAFNAVETSGGELEVSVPTGTTTTDPCAVPQADGYSGDDNRLYRIEVHRGGSLAQLQLKWSRDNGSELFTSTLSTTGDLILEAGTPLAAGDLVEVLSGVIDLGDDAHAMVAPGSFVPAQRAVGQLGQLVEVTSQAGDDTVRFRLAEVADANVQLPLDDRYGDLARTGMKLRRWHGLLDPQQLAGGNPATGGPYVLEDGVRVTMTGAGTYRPGQYWQYQARTGTAPPEPWQRSPHGPARRFAPLALLRLPESSPPGTSHDSPWELLAWLDDRFDHLCELESDGVAFDGDRVGTGSNTVQEALEELYGRIPETQTWPTVAGKGISWRNDRPLPLSQFSEGLRVTFSEEMHPATASPSSFVVTLEVPEPGSPRSTRPLIVDGSVSVAGHTWTFVPLGIQANQVADWAEALGGGVRCRVRLASDVILDRAGERPLDGDATGLLQDDGYETFVDLRLPSGDGNRGGDFHSWFFLDGPPAFARVESVTPADAERITPDAQIGAVMISFSQAVRFDSLTPDTVQVFVRPENEAGDGTRVPGRMQPYPFEPDPRLVSRITFAPDDPTLLRPDPGALDVARVFTVRVLGAGDDPVLDGEGRPLDGAGTGEPSDFTSQFVLARQA